MRDLLVLVASKDYSEVVLLFCSFSMALGHTDDITWAVEGCAFFCMDRAKL